MALTLLELAIALVIIGILAAIAGTSYRAWMGRSDIYQAISDIQRIQSGIDRWINEFGSPPRASPRSA